MITYGDAISIIRTVSLPLGSEVVPLVESLGRRLAADLVAKVPSPPFTNSAMDGFAVRRSDPSLSSGIPLAILGTRIAGAVALQPPLPDRLGTCARIMTGAALPSWADTVIPVENADVSSGQDLVTFRDLHRFATGAHIRRVGEDAGANSVVLKAGTLISPEHVMMAAAFGAQTMTVTALPRIHLVSTGDELAEPGSNLPEGMIYNSSKYFLMAATRTLGRAAQITQIKDDVHAAMTTFRGLLEDGYPSLLITTGAVSAGTTDFVPTVARDLGFRLLFHKVAIRPGKPIFLASRADGSIWLGLPGNPISTCVGWYFFARPLLAFLGIAPEAKRSTVRLMNTVTKPKGLRCFFRANLSEVGALVLPRQGSSDLTTSATSTAYLDLPEDLDCVPVDARVEALIP